MIFDEPLKNGGLSKRFAGAGKGGKVMLGAGRLNILTHDGSLSTDFPEIVLIFDLFQGCSVGLIADLKS